MLGFDMFQTKIHSALLKVFHSAFGNSLKKFCFNKIVQGKGWLLKILHHESRHSTMSRFNKFQVRIYSALCKLFHSVFGNSPKKFRAIRVQIKQLGTSSINLKASSWSTSINEWIVKRIEGLLGKMLLMIHFGAVTYKSCHHQLLAGFHVAQIQVSPANNKINLSNFNSDKKTQSAALFWRMYKCKDEFHWNAVNVTVFPQTP